MSTEIAKLDVVERKDLRKLESIIERGMGTFVEVGSALKQIRDSRLYRESHKTFERYVTERWMIKKSYAYDLIASSEVVENVRNCGQIELPPNESIARELGKAAPEKQAEIWEDVTDETDEPTAADVKAAVERHKAPKQNGKPIDEAADRARRKIPELIRSLKLQLDNLGLSFDADLDRIAEAAR